LTYNPRMPRIELPCDRCGQVARVNRDSGLCMPCARPVVASLEALARHRAAVALAAASDQARDRRIRRGMHRWTG
jgi:hypothetical protein